MINVVLGGLFTSELSDAAAILIAFTGLFGSAAHYAAILTNSPKKDVDRATGIGFFFGFALGVLVLVLDVLT